MNDYDLSAVAEPDPDEDGMLEGHAVVIPHILDEILNIAIRQLHRRALKYGYPQPVIDEIETTYRNMINERGAGIDGRFDDLHLDVDGENVIDLYGVRLILCDIRGFGLRNPTGNELQHHLGIRRNGRC